MCYSYRIVRFSFYFKILKKEVKVKKIILIIVSILFLIIWENSENSEKNNVLKVSILRKNEEKEKIKVYLYSYDERIADKAATLLSEKEVELASKETVINFLVPREYEKEIYYIVLDKSDNYMLDYSKGGIEKLKIGGINKVKIIKNE